MGVMEEQVNSIPKDSLMEIPSELVPKKTEDPVVSKEQQLEQGADTTAAIFKRFHPEFLARVNNLSNKSLRRLIKAMVSLPLEDAKLNLKMDDEREAFMIAMNLMDAKNYLMLYTKYKHAEDLAQHQASTIAEQAVSSSSEENVTNNMENLDNGKESQ